MNGSPIGPWEPSGSPIGPWEPRFLELIDLPAPTPLLVVTALAIAAVIGALHALAPGHGKAIAAAYLVGGRGSAKDALLLGVAVAAMHSASVLALGVGLHVLATSAELLARVGPWLATASGLLVLLVGLGSLARLLRHRRGHRRARHEARDHAPQHDTPHDAHHHDHVPHLPPGVAPLSRRGLVLIGLSGGLLPSPSAFLVLTTALFTGRTLFGLALVAAFSAGLATTLTLLGLAVLRGRTMLSRRGTDRPRLAAALETLPLAGAVLVTLGGVWLTATALRAL